MGFFFVPGSQTQTGSSPQDPPQLRQTGLTGRFATLPVGCLSSAYWASPLGIALPAGGLVFAGEPGLNSAEPVPAAAVTATPKATAAAMEILTRIDLVPRVSGVLDTIAGRPSPGGSSAFWWVTVCRRVAESKER